MDNHDHLLVETPIANLSAGMRQLNGIYTQAFNRRHQRVGHLFQGRFKAIVVKKQAHVEYGYNLKQIAEVLEIYSSTVSKVIKNTQQTIFSLPDLLKFAT